MTRFPDTDTIHGLMVELDGKRKPLAISTMYCSGGYYRLTKLPDADQVGMLHDKYPDVARATEFYTDKGEYIERVRSLLAECIGNVPPECIELRQLREAFKSMYKNDATILSFPAEDILNIPVFDSNTH